MVQYLESGAGCLSAVLMWDLWQRLHDDLNLVGVWQFDAVSMAVQQQAVEQQAGWLPPMAVVELPCPALLPM